MAYFDHPQSLCETTDVGEGSRIWAFANVMPGARIGAASTATRSAATLARRAIVREPLPFGLRVPICPVVVCLTEVPPVRAPYRHPQARLERAASGWLTCVRGHRVRWCGPPSARRT
jgi:hypothetical protein